MLIILRGAPASGKSTYVQELRTAFGSDLVSVSRDALRFAHFGEFWGKGVDEGYITVLETAGVRSALLLDKIVVLDATNLRGKYLNPLVDIAYQLGKEVELVDHFKDVPLAELLERNSKRDRVVPDKVIAEMWQASQRKYELPKRPAAVNPYKATVGLPKAVLFDLDGTCAIIGDRSPYDDMKAQVDSPNESVRLTANAVHNLGYEVVYVSARQERSREIASDWLNAHGFPHGMLYMRQTGDMRKDWVVKNELFESILSKKYHVIYALDDRNQVVDMYRRKGIPVHQVAHGDF